MKLTRRYCLALVFEMVLVLPNNILLGQSKNNLPQGDTFVIQTPKGEVRVKNFFKKYPLTAPEIYGDALVQLPCDTVYNGTTKTFDMAVSMSGTSYQEFRRSREQLQNQLLRILGISRKDACKLNIKVAAVNKYADFGPEFYQSSFCSSPAKGRSRNNPRK